MEANKKMHISGTLFTLFLLLVSVFIIFALSNSIRIDPAFAINQSPGRDSLRNLQDDSIDQFAFLKEISNGFGSQSSGNSDSNLYENPEIGLRVPIPPDWRESPPEEEWEGFEIQFQPSSRQDVFFAISVWGIDPSLTREGLNELNLQTFREQGFNIVNSGPIDIAGGNIQGFFIEYEYEDYQGNLRGTVVSVLRNGNEYSFDFGGTPETYNRYLQVGQQMVNSIDITEYAGSGEFGQGQGFGQDQGQGFGQDQGQGFGQDQGQGFGQDQGQGFGQGNSGQFGQQDFEGNRSNSDLLEYSNSSLGFRIAYPVQSEVSEEPNNVTFDMDQGLARVSVVTDVGIALDRYSDSRIGEIREGAEGFHVISSEESTLSGNPAHSLSYSTEENGTMLRAFALWTVSDNTAYNLVFIAPVSAFESLRPCCRKYDRFV